MSKINKFLSSLKKNQNIELVYKNEYDILNGKKNLQHIINATNIFCDKKIFMLRLEVLEDLH